MTNESSFKLKKSLDDFIQDKSIITGREVVQKIIEQEKRHREFQSSVEDELRNRRVK